MSFLRITDFGMYCPSWGGLSVPCRMAQIGSSHVSLVFADAAVACSLGRDVRGQFGCQRYVVSGGQ
jgi:hypothetical protein